MIDVRSSIRAATPPGLPDFPTLRVPPPYFPNTPTPCPLYFHKSPLYHMLNRKVTPILYAQLLFLQFTT